MSPENQDALRCADALRQLDSAKKHHPSGPGGQMMGCESYRLIASGFSFYELQNSADHLDRLVAENEALREDLRKFREAASCERDLRQEQERYATALVRQMLEALWPWDVEDANHTEQYAAITAAREWLANKGD